MVPDMMKKSDVNSCCRVSVSKIDAVATEINFCLTWILRRSSGRTDPAFEFKRVG